VSVDKRVMLPTPGRLSVGRQLRANGIFVAVTAVILAGALVVPNFGTLDNFSAVIRSVSFIGIIAVGMTFVVIAGAMVDLSIPTAVAGAAILAIRLQDYGLPVAIGAALLIPTLLGVVNGFVCGVLRVNPVVGTLATTTVGGGLILIGTNGGEFSYGSSDAFYRFGTHYVFGLPISVWVMLAAFIVGHWLLAHTRYGAYVYATGSNYAAARASGVPVRLTVFIAFVLTSLLAAISGILIAAYSNLAAFKVADGYEFEVISAVLIGGASLLGGTGSMIRTLAGVIFAGVVTNILILFGAPFEAQLMVKGTIIIVAVALDIWLARRNSE
jgi:ribose/xylose/arabinose/galactoside ABC-type transport system permease subunit